MTAVLVWFKGIESGILTVVILKIRLRVLPLRLPKFKRASHMSASVLVDQIIIVESGL